MTPGGTTSLGTLIVYLTANASQYNRALKSVEADTGAIMENLVKQAKYASIAVAGSMALISAAGVREFSKFDDAMVKSLAIMGDVSQATRNEMEKTARVIALDTVTTADNLAKGYQGLASAGLDAAQSIKALGISEKFSVAGQMSMDKSVLTLTDSVSALGLATNDAAQYQKNITRVADVLAMGANISQASVEQLADALQGKVAGGLRMVNKEVEEGVAVIGAFAAAGVKGLDANEKFSQVLRDLQVAFNDNRLTWERFGLSVYDANGRMLHMADILQQLEGLMGGMTDEQKRLTLTTLGFQDRTVSATTAILGMSNLIRQFEKDLKSANGTTEDMWKIQLTSLNSQWTIFTNKIREMLIVVGTELLPILTTTNAYLTEFLKANNNAEGGVRTLSQTISGTLVTSLGIAADVLHGWKIVLVGVEIAVTTLGGVIAWFAKGGEIAILGLSAVFEKSLKGWTAIVEGTSYGLKLGFSKLLLWIRETQIQVAESLNNILPEKNGQKKYTEAWFAPLRQQVAELKASIAGIKPPNLDMTTDAGTAMEKAIEEFKTFAREQDAFSQRNKELTAELWRLIDAGAPSEKIAEAVAKAQAELAARLAATAGAAGAATGAVNGTTGAVGKLGGTVSLVTPQLVELENLLRDPLGNVYMESVVKLDTVMRQGLLTAQQYDAALRQIISQQNQFIMPTTGLMNPTGDQNVDQFIELQNEQALLEKAYNDKLRATQEYYTNQKALHAANAEEVKRLEEVRLATLAEMQANYMSQTELLERKKGEMALAAAQSTADSLVDIAKNLSGEQSGIYKAMFLVSKAFAIADAIIKIQQGIAAAAALPFPANIGAMATVAAATASIVSSIQAVGLNFEGGGYTGSGPRTGGLDGKGGMLAMVHPQERIIDEYKGQTAMAERYTRQQEPVVQKAQRIAMNFEGGGYTGDGPRSGGVDGKGGMIALVHPQEEIVDEYAQGSKRGGRSADAADVTVEQVVNVHNYAGVAVTTQKSDDGRQLDIYLRKAEERMASNIRDGKGPIPRALQDTYKVARGKR